MAWKREYGCLMLDLELKGWKPFIDQFILDSDLYKEEGYGREYEPHCTLLYGFHDGVSIEDVKPFLCKVEDIDLSIKNITLFENEKFDVVKYDIRSVKLHELNNKLMTEFKGKYTVTYPDYHPHLTIAYVLPGKGKNYARNGLLDLTVKPVRYNFSNIDNTNSFLTL